MPLARADCVELDLRDPLAAHRHAFALPTASSTSTATRSAPCGGRPARLREVVENEWAAG